MTQKHNLTPAQAVYIATQMEQRAVSLYERALLVFAQGKMKQVLQELLEDERSHLSGFERLQQMEGTVAPEDALALDSEAGGILFSDGITGAVREGAFDSPISLLHFAADEEERAAQRYHGFAEATFGETRETFLLISWQEQRHLERLKTQISLLEETDA